ncbi:MAG: aconitase X catalytic domain-containing protein, partial [Alphaproteobacteria bacterium]|nr:aconitase X catalytic domain-containing protein [Alphaproteobacteria bacterium]
EERRPRAFATADFRGFDEDTFRFLLPGRDLAAESAEAVGALGKLGVVTSHAYVNDHSVTAPGFGEACGYSGTPSVVYMNGIVGARCNFEAGPSSLAAFFTGRVPRYGFHLDEKRLATYGFKLNFTPRTDVDWGIVGALIGRKLNSYWSVPALEITGPRPTVLDLNHMALSMASYGSIAMFHVIGITPEAPDWKTACGGKALEPEVISQSDLDAFYAEWGGVGEKLDVVALSTPQLDIPDIVQIAERLNGRKVHSDTTLLVYTSIEIKEACARIGLNQTIEKAGGRVVHGHDFFATFAKEIRETHGWERLMTHSVKMVNICEGYGYKPTPAAIPRCIDSAIAGKVLP